MQSRDNALSENYAKLRYGNYVQWAMNNTSVNTVPDKDFAPPPHTHKQKCGLGVFYYQSEKIMRPH